MTDDCVFCRIAAGAAPARFVYQDDQVIAFHDIAPVAPTHILIVPRRHIVSTAHIDDQTAPLMGRLVQVAAQIARAENVEASGYRLIVNSGPDSGQIVMHLHVHLLAGRRMGRLG